VDVLGVAAFGAVFLLNSPYGPADVWDHLPAAVRETIIRKAIRLYVIDADRLALHAGLGRRINTIMQTCFFALARVVPVEQAIDAVKDAIRKSYGKRGDAVVTQNCGVVDLALEHLHECNVLDRDVVLGLPAPVPPAVPEFVRTVTLPLMSGHGDALPVSVFPADGTFPPATSKWEKRNLASAIPDWDDKICIQCGKCVMVCPHAALRAKVYEPVLLTGAPTTFKSSAPRWKTLQNLRYTLQVAPEDCTGCSLCVEVCPVQSKADAHHKALNMVPQAPIRSRERTHWEFFLELPDHRDPQLAGGIVKRTQLLQPLFEFSGACAGCGETPYLRLLTQLFGDRAIIANATGCSSIYGGNLPTTPYTVNSEGRGPAWANSLFEDNAEFGLGIKLAIDAQRHHAEMLVKALEPAIGCGLSGAILFADQTSEAGVTAQRSRVGELMTRMAALETAEARDLRVLAGSLIRKSVWIVGGDGWAYDIGFGGLDHVLASGEHVKVLVLDTEVYSNTGGQRSKATPRGAVARFAAGGKTTAKKDLALMAMSYGNVYVARVALGANDTQTVQAFEEAEAFDGPALILAYGACVAHGYDLVHSLDQQKLAVRSGYWPLLRYNPERTKSDQNPLVLDSQPPSVPLGDYLCNELRFTRLTAADNDELLRDAEADVANRWRVYSEMASAHSPSSSATS
jgi:pyruvate-ferredoxin/flavodoxin oxidoreductase